MLIYLRGGEHHGRTLEWDQPALRLPIKRKESWTGMMVRVPNLESLTSHKDVTYEITFPRQYVTVLSEDVSFPKGTRQQDTAFPVASATVYEIIGR